jgi:excisionase family DNA binding protein
MDPRSGASPAERAEAGSTIGLGEAAETLGVSASTLRRWADDGRLGVLRTTGGHRRFVAGDVRRLRRKRAGEQRPLLRPAHLPEGPISQFASLISEQGGDLRRRAALLLYEPGRGGWFAGSCGAGHLEAWLGALRAAAAGEVGWDTAMHATRELARHARSGGAAQVEGHLLLVCLDDLVQFRLRERGVSQTALTEVRRLFRALHRAIIDTRLEVSG